MQSTSGTDRAEVPDDTTTDVESGKRRNTRAAEYATGSHSGRPRNVTALQQLPSSYRGTYLKLMIERLLRQYRTVGPH